MPKYTPPESPHGARVLRGTCHDALVGNKRESWQRYECDDGTVFHVENSGPATVTCACGEVTMTQSENATKIRSCKLCKVTITLRRFGGRVASARMA